MHLYMHLPDRLLHLLALKLRTWLDVAFSRVKNLQQQAPCSFYYLPGGIPKTGSLEFLRHTQQYQVLRPLVQADQSLARPIVDEIREQNPQLMQKILDNKTDFRLLVLGLPLVGEESSNQMAQPQEPTNEGGDGGNQMEQPENEIELTREENKSIQRLEAIGFERSVVVKVFLDFNKDEHLAATFPLDHKIYNPKFQ